jgi:hypothetical protein
MAMGAALLLYHYSRGNKDWLEKAQMAMEESVGEVETHSAEGAPAGGHATE